MPVGIQARDDGVPGERPDPRRKAIEGVETRYQSVSASSRAAVPRRPKTRPRTTIAKPVTMTRKSHTTEDSKGGRKYQSRLDTVFYVLAHRRRRAAIGYLRERAGPVEYQDLVEAIHRWELAGSDPPTPPSRRRNVEVDVNHSHLPKLVAAGVVERDDDGYTYSSDPVVEEILDALDGTDVRAIPHPV